MDIEKLIEQYQKAFEHWRKNRTNFPDVAASQLRDRCVGRSRTDIGAVERMYA